MNYMEGIFVMVDLMYKDPILGEFMYETSNGDIFRVAGDVVTIKRKGDREAVRFTSERHHHEVAKEIHGALYKEFNSVRSSLAYNKPAGKVDLRKRRWK